MFTNGDNTFNFSNEKKIVKKSQYVREDYYNDNTTYFNSESCFMSRHFLRQIKTSSKVSRKIQLANINLI